MKKITTLGLLVAATLLGSCEEKEEFNVATARYETYEDLLQATDYKTMSYDSLVAAVEKNGGSLSIDLRAAEVGVDEAWSSYHSEAFGYAWVHKMQGVYDSLLVSLKTTHVGTDKEDSKWSDSEGYGYAWAKTMEGTIAGNPLTLQAVDVVKEKDNPSIWNYQGFGFAHTEYMEGTLGDKLVVDLTATGIVRNRDDANDYVGFGYEWTNDAALVIIKKSD